MVKSTCGRMACLALGLVVGWAGTASAATRAWWRFDDAAPGTVATGEMCFANSEGGVQSAVPQSQSGKNLGTDPAYMPRFSEPLGGSERLVVYDPVSGAAHTNRAALHFQGTVGTTVDPASAVWVPNTDLKFASFTAECFFRAPTSIGSQTMSTLLHMQRITGAATWTLQIYGGGLFVRSTIKKDSSTVVKCDYVKYEINTVKDGKWHHAAITYNAETLQMKLWLDYVCLATWTYEENDGFDYVSNGKFLIGANTVQTGRNFPGDIDEVRLSDVALPASSFLRMKELDIGQDPDTVVRLAFDSDLRLAGARLGVLNAAPDSTYAVRFATTGTSTETGFRPGDTDEVCSTNLSEGAWGANRPNLGSFLSLTNAIGKGQFMVVADSTAALSTESFTAECFFKLDGPIQASAGDGDTVKSLVPMGCAAFRAIFDARPSYRGQFVLRAFTDPTGDKFVQTTLYDFANSRGDSAVAAAANWHHLAFVYDKAAQTVRWYLDYKLRATHTNIELRGGIEKNGEFCFGANSAAGSQPFSGRLDECRIVRRALRPWEFLTSTHVDGNSRVWIDYEDGMGAKPDPMGAGEGSLQAGGQVSERIRQSYSHAVCDVDGNVLRANQEWSYHIKSSRYNMPGLSETHLPSFTLELFLRATQLTDSNNILAIGSSSLKSQRYWSLRNGTQSGSLCFKLVTSEADAEPTEKTVDFPAGNYADSKWRHIAVSVGPSAVDTEVKLYVDHVCVATETVAGTYVVPRVEDSGAHLCLGAAGIDVAMDEIRILDGVYGPDAFLYPAPPSGSLLLVR